MVQVFQHEHYLRRVKPGMRLTVDRKVKDNISILNVTQHHAMAVQSAGVRGTDGTSPREGGECMQAQTYFQVALSIY